MSSSTFFFDCLPLLPPPQQNPRWTHIWVHFTPCVTCRSISHGVFHQVALKAQNARTTWCTYQLRGLGSLGAQQKSSCVLASIPSKDHWEEWSTLNISLGKNIWKKLEWFWKDVPNPVTLNTKWQKSVSASWMLENREHSNKRHEIHMWLCILLLWEVLVSNGPFKVINYCPTLPEYTSP